MSVVIRLAKTGKRGERKFRVVVSEKRSRRDGRAIEVLGWYEKNVGSTRKKVDRQRFDYWIKNGAIASKTVTTLMEI